MFIFSQTGLNGYSRMGDLAVAAICCIIFILLGTSYVKRTKEYRIFSAIVGIILVAAGINIAFNYVVRLENPNFIFASYALRLLYHIFLFDVFVMFALYAVVAAKIEHHKAQAIAIISTVLFFTTILVDVILTVTGVGFVIDDQGVVLHGSNVFLIGNIVFVVFLGFVMIDIRKLLYKRVLWGFYATSALGLIIRFSQVALNNSSLVTFSFVLPVLAMLYIMHLNPYNSETGTLNSKAMEDMIETLYKNKKSFIVMSLLLPDYVGEDKTLPDIMKDQTRRFTIEYFRNGTLFQIGNGQIVMIARKDSNPDYEEWMQSILDAFIVQYNMIKIPYKIVYGESYEEMIGYNEYLSFFDNAYQSIPLNTIHRVSEDDLLRFEKTRYITNQLEDIYKRMDLNDPRVLVYCQPVYNIQTGRFDTAEALMRLNLADTGVIYPDSFVPIAESRGYIHVLTRIILNKTCRNIRDMMDDGYKFTRISVNVASRELKDNQFCEDIITIINKNNIPGDKIALELTESQSDEDFLVMKEKIEKLHSEGIMFYLDDFGTGYSNMERILELPFDIIKFDRSMVIASGLDERSEQIVEKLAKMFADFNYSVLYEGIENSIDENRCLNMAASYLQGYKYSRPLPIDELRNFFNRPN